MDPKNNVINIMHLSKLEHLFKKKKLKITAVVTRALKIQIFKIQTPKNYSADLCS